MENDPIEIVDLPINSIEIVDLPSMVSDA